MYLGGALRRTPFFAIRRPGRNAYFYRLARIVFGVGGRGTGWRESFFLLVGGGIFARNREDPAPTVGQRGGCDDWYCGERARSLVRQAIRRDIFWPYAANGVPLRCNRGRWAWTGDGNRFLGGGESSRFLAKISPPTSW